MRQWEYKMIFIGRDDELKELNKLGRQGWELVNAYMGSGTCGILKREIEQHPAQEVKRENIYDQDRW
jgi:hypothetical protein